MDTKIKDASYPSRPGIDLIGKVLAGRCKMVFTRIAVGKGYLSDEQNPRDMDAPPDYVMDAKISSVTTPVGGECQVQAHINSTSVDDGFFLTSMVLYAQDPDDGEVPFTYVSLEENPEWIRPRSASVHKLATFDLVTAVGDVENVTAVIDPDAIMTRKEVEELIAITPKRVVHFIALQPHDWVTEADAPYIDMPLSASTDTAIPHVEILPESYEVAAACGLSDVATARDGYVRFSADKVPSATIHGFALLVDNDGAALPGDPGIIPGVGAITGALLPATTDRLGVVKVGAGLDISADGTISADVSDIEDRMAASDEDVENMLDSVYGEDAD